MLRDMAVLFFVFKNKIKEISKDCTTDFKLNFHIVPIFLCIVMWTLLIIIIIYIMVSKWEVKIEAAYLSKMLLSETAVS